MKKIIFILAMVGMILTGCREPEDARKINKYFAEKGIEGKVKYKNRAEAVEGIFVMLFQNNYFRNNPKEAADFITKSEYYEVVFKLEGLLYKSKESQRKVYEYKEKHGIINDYIFLNENDINYANHVALLSLINIFSLPEKPLIAQDALELFKTIIELMNDIVFYNIKWERNQAGLPRGFAVFLLDDSTSVLQQYYPNLYDNPNLTFPYLADLKTAPEGFKEIILNAPYLKKGGFKRSFSVTEKLFENFKATSPQKGGFIFEYDDQFNRISGRVFDYKTDLLYPVSNPNNACIIIREKCTYQDVSNLYSAAKSPIYLVHHNIQVINAVSGKILFARNYRSTPKEYIYSENKYNENNYIENAFEYNDEFYYGHYKFIDVKKEIESIISKM